VISEKLRIKSSYKISQIIFLEKSNDFSSMTYHFSLIINSL
jgi:hypothetical protein